jgi:hypothetical protein
MISHTHDVRLQETPRRKIFLLMILVMGVLIATGFVLMVKSRRHEPVPQAMPLQPITRLNPPPRIPTPTLGLGVTPFSI